MAQERLPIAEFRAVWLVVMFDLPVVTPEDRAEYTRFRKRLLRQGFIRLQLSVYARFSSSEERGETFHRRIQAALPPGGEVRIMTVTDFQFGKMKVFHGRSRRKTEEPPKQLVLL